MLEDRLLLKVIQVVQSWMLDSEATEQEVSSSIFDSQRISHEKQNLKNNIFFEDVIVTQGDITMSLVATGKLEEDLLNLKRQLGDYYRNNLTFDASKNSCLKYGWQVSHLCYKFILTKWNYQY